MNLHTVLETDLEILVRVREIAIEIHLKVECYSKAILKLHTAIVFM